MQSKLALVLAGGGLTGAVYEIGALRAIDDMLVDRSVNDFDIFVGTSAGALVSSMISNGISPQEMLQVLDGSHPEMRALQRQDIFGINYREMAGWMARLPRKVLRAWVTYLFNRSDMTLFDLLWTLSEALPPGLYDSMALERFVRKSLAEKGGSNNFATLARELYIIATDLDTGKRVVFGRDENPEVPISTAVAASSALPLVYKPVRVNGHEYVDGGLRGNASLDLAIEKGATLVLCINPLVPINNEAHQFGGSYLSEKGIRLVADQTLRITSHSGLQYHVKQLRRRHPEVDIILIEPSPDRSQMFNENIMRYSARVAVAQHGFRSMTIDLQHDYHIYKEIMARHGVPISRKVVIDELATMNQAGNDLSVVRRVLEARSPCDDDEDSPLCKLNRTLAALEVTLDALSDEQRPAPPPEEERLYKSRLIPYSLE